MNKLNISSILVALGLAFSVSAIAQNMSKDEHEAAEKYPRLGLCFNTQNQAKGTIYHYYFYFMLSTRSNKGAIFDPTASE